MKTTLTQEVKMTNKILREKSNCIVCRSSKSRFLNQKHNNKKIDFTNYKTCKFIVKAVKNIQVTRFLKKLILIQREKTKVNENVLFF